MLQAPGTQHQELRLSNAEEFALTSRSVVAAEQQDCHGTGGGGEDEESKMASATNGEGGLCSMHGRLACL